MKQVINLSENTKNILLMATGAILFLHTLGIFACSLNTFVIVIAVGLFAAGFVRGGYWDKVRRLLGKNFGKK